MKITFAVSNRLPHLLAIAALAIGMLSAPAQTNAPARSQAGRYLIVVETSDAMKRRAENTQLVLGSLLASGLNGQLREGDSISVWTFNEDLVTRQSPQRWSPQLRQHITKQFAEFLGVQKYDKKANLAKVTEALAPLITNSHKLTVMLVTEGSTKINGTPYDAEINEIFKASSSEQKKQKMPFVTVLRTKQGEFIGNTVGLPPWPVEFPAFPPEPKPVPPPKKAKAPPPVAKPLVVIGNTNPPPPVVPTPPPPPVNPPPQSDPAPPLSTIAPSEPAATPPPPTEPVKPVPTPEIANQPPVTAPPVASETAPPAPPAVVEKAESSDVPTNRAAFAVTAAPNPLLSRNNLLIAGGALILGSGIFLVALMRRPKNTGRISLITHSIDREEK